MASPAGIDEPGSALRARVQGVLDVFFHAQRRVLHPVVPDVEPLLDAAAHLLSRGKRLRPTFCYWGWRARAGPAGDELTHAITTAGAALELFQACALVHDDLIDGSATRRGAPSIHRQFARQHRQQGWHGDSDAFGRATAILLGDLLLGWSDELLTHSGLPPDALARARPVFELMRTEVAAGQYLDIVEQARAGDSDPDDAVARARTVIRYKSARYSVEHPLVMGGRIADAPESVLSGYRAYGRALGEAFQLRDDILGVFGDPARTGKPAGDDLREGKRTVLIAFALQRADPAQRRVIVTRLGDRDLNAAGVDDLRQVLVETGALARTETLVSELVSQARAALDATDVTDDGRAALAQLVELATDRAR